MSMYSRLNDCTIQVLEYKPVTSKTGSLDRQPQIVRTDTCHVKPLTPTQVTIGGNQISQEVDHHIWFDHDPGLTEGHEIIWIAGAAKTYLRITKVPMDLHGLGRIWMGSATSKRADNSNPNTVSVEDML